MRDKVNMNPLAHEEMSERQEGLSTPQHARIADAVARLGGKRKAAKAAGISESQLYRYLNGQSIPTWPPMVELARAAGVSLDWLALLSDSPQPGQPEAQRDWMFPVKILTAILEGIDQTSPDGLPVLPAGVRAELAARIHTAVLRVVSDKADEEGEVTR